MKMDIPPKENKEEELFILPKENFSSNNENQEKINIKKDTNTKEDNFIPSLDILRVAEGLQIDDQVFLDRAIDENGNIKDLSKVFEDYFKKEVEKKLEETYSKNTVKNSNTNDFIWKSRDYANVLINKLIKHEFNKDIDNIILVKSLMDFSKNGYDYLEYQTLADDIEDQSLISILNDKNTSILEKIFIKQIIFEIEKLKDSWNYEYRLKDLKKRIGSLKSIKKFDDKKFNHKEFNFNQNQKNLIIYDNNYVNMKVFMEEGWHEYNYKESKIIFKSAKKEFLKDFIVSKLSPNMVGIYSLKGRLIGWQKIDDFEKGEQGGVVKDFFEIKKECPMNSKEDLALFKISSSLYFRDYIEQLLSIDLSQLSIENQFYFLNFIQGKTEDKLTEFKKFIKNSENKEERTNKLKTFLSIEQGGKEMGDKIIGLGEKLPEDVAKKVFTKYGEIIDNVSKITEFARNNFTKEIETDSELIKKIEETLYIKGKQLLSQAYDDISNKKEVNYEDIGKQLDRINADTITTFAIFKQAVKNGEKLPIESIEGSVFSKKEASDISDNQQHEMLELYESNWKNHPDRDFVESLKSYFKTSFVPENNKQKNYFYTFEKDNNIRAFVRFEKQNDASFYASALNVDEASKNFGLGEAMMDEALTREAKEHILHASCRKDNESNMRYFEKGFISRGFKKTNETEEFDLIWDENKNKYILAKQKSQEELISMENTEDIEIRKSKNLESLHTEIPEGKSLVRCFINNREWYAVYEKVKDDYGMNLGETK